MDYRLSSAAGASHMFLQKNHWKQDSVRRLSHRAPRGLEHPLQRARFLHAWKRTRRIMCAKEKSRKFQNLKCVKASDGGDETRSALEEKTWIYAAEVSEHAGLLLGRTRGSFREKHPRAARRFLKVIPGSELNSNGSAKVCLSVKIEKRKKSMNYDALY